VACARCAGPTIDLSREAQGLEGRWPLWEVHRAGKRLFAPVVARRSKWIRRAAVVLAVLHVGGAFTLGLFKSRAPGGLLWAELLGLTLGAAIALPLVWLFHTAFLFVAALTFHFIAIATGALARWAPIGELRFRVVSVISAFISRPLLGLMHLDVPDRLRTKHDVVQNGQLAEPVQIDFVRDALGVLERADASFASPLVVRFDGGAPEQLDLDAGVLQCDQPGVTSGTAELPAWLRPAREGTARRAEFRAGTRVVVRRSPGLVQLQLL
jgi:hypothetical protein